MHSVGFLSSLALLSSVRVIVMRVMVMAVLMPVFMVVVFAAIRGDGQLAAQISRHQFLDGCPGWAGAHRDAMLGEDGQGATADATGDDRSHSQLPQPTRERPRLMLGRWQHVGAERGLLLGVDLDHGKLAAAAEMVVETSVLNWNGDLHR
jgi:hypothetical protein